MTKPKSDCCAERWPSTIGWSYRWFTLPTALIAQHTNRKCFCEREGWSKVTIFHVNNQGSWAGKDGYSLICCDHLPTQPYSRPCSTKSARLTADETECPFLLAHPSPSTKVHIRFLRGACVSFSPRNRHITAHRPAPESHNMHFGVC